MKSIYRTFATTVTLACLTSVSTVASAEIVNFDDLTGGPAFFTSPYHGLTFADTGTSSNGDANWFWSDAAPPSTYKSKFTSVSTEAALPVGGVPSIVEKESLKISAASPFVLAGAWFTGLDENISVTFCLYLNGVMVGAGSTAVLNLGAIGAGQDSTQYQYLATGYSGPIDAFTVHGLQGYFAMDDLAINVPEPGSYALVLAALSAMALVKRRKNV